MDTTKPIPGSIPPSTGKTAIIAGAVPLAIQELMVDTFGPEGPYHIVWFTPHYASNLMIVAVGLSGWLMHNTQRSHEKTKAAADAVLSPSN